MLPMSLRFVALVALAPWSSAQGFYLDLGPAGSPHGIPAPTYGGAGPPGVWQALSLQVTNGLIDTAGSATTVSLSIDSAPLLDDCGQAGTLGDDAALYDDRMYFNPAFVEFTVSGLAPGIYRVHVHLLTGTCVAMFPPLTVEISGAVPNFMNVDGFGWSGAPQEGANYSNQLKVIGAGEDLVISTYSTIGFCCWTQVCGLQIIPVEPLVAGCFGDGSGAPCPCGNFGASNAGCLNSTGLGGRLLPSGTTSVAVDDLRFTAHDLPPGLPTLLFSGTGAIAGGAGTPFRDGVRCAGGAVVRLGVTTSGAGGLAFWGPGLAAAGGWSPGSTRRFQAWYRDPSGPCATGSNFTNSIEATFVP